MKYNLCFSAAVQHERKPLITVGHQGHQDTCKGNVTFSSPVSFLNLVDPPARVEDIVATSSTEDYQMTTDEEKDGQPENHLQTSPTQSSPISSPIVPEEWIPFKLEQPSAAIKKSLEDQNLFHENASRLLLMTVNWVRSLPAFQVLPLETQTSVLRDCWGELFCLGFIHRQDGELLNCQDVVIDNDAPGIPKLQGFLHSALKLELDDHELAFLKVLALFSKDRALKFGELVFSSFEEICALAVEEMVEYVKGKTKEGAASAAGVRIANVLLLLPELR